MWLKNSSSSYNFEQDKSLVTEVFHIAEKCGGIWHIIFTPYSIDIFTKDGKYVQFPYKIEPNYFSCKKFEMNGRFPYLIKEVAETCGHLFYSKKHGAYAPGSMYSSVDGGNSYQSESVFGTVVEYHVCSKEFYMRYKPF